MKICTAALSAKGEKFNAPPAADPSMCKAAMGGTSSSTPTTAGGYGGGNMTGGGNSTNTTSGSNPAGTSPIASQGAAAAISAVESFKLLISCAMLGVAAYALTVL